MSESVFNPSVTEIFAAAAPMPLDAGAVNASLAAKLRALDPASIVAPAPLGDRRAAQACLAGLWLRINALDDAHRMAQELEMPEGSLWHAIMHRREGDYSNSKYWFRRVGPHPVFAKLGSDWDPFAFVDRVEAHVTHGSGDAAELIQAQEREWNELFGYCWQQAHERRRT